MKAPAEPTEKPPFSHLAGMYSLSPGLKKEPNTSPTRFLRPSRLPTQARQLHLHLRLALPNPRLHGPQDRTVTPTEQTLQDNTLQTSILRCTKRYLLKGSQVLSGKLATSPVTDTFLCSTCILLTVRRTSSPRDRACTFYVPGTQTGPQRCSSAS